MPSIKEPDLALAGLALLVIFGLLIWYDRPVESARPFDPYIQHQDLQATGYAYESWLWQDPFGFDLDSYTERNQYYIDFGDNLEKAPPYRFRVYKKTDVEPIAHEESEDKKKETEGKKTEPEEGQCEYELNKKISDIKNNDNATTVKILAPLLKVRPNTTENKELRTRDRYAVIAGLIESGYHPLEPDRLHFCSTQENKKYDVRWEHFHYELKYQSGILGKNEKDQRNKNAPNDKPDIIVVWMNSEIFIDDARFGSLSASLFKSKEISKIDFHIYDLNNILDQKRSAWITEKIDRTNNENYKNKGIELKGIQTDDEALIKKLTKELLELRNIKELSEVMIITEQDSENVRSLAHNFVASLCDSFPKPINANPENGACEIKNSFYLKGLDAYQQVLHKQDKNEDAYKPAARFSAIDLNIPSPLPIGPSQFDYFHRLAKQINDSHKEINLEKRDSGIKAVGIFGSDFYDKLMILEALRAEMPNILVFTTELGAQMLHPPHWLSTRNLVVASHFNLLLSSEYQKQFPPFRDSQQTNIFFHTISAVKGHVKETKNLSPQIFEVGRNGFVRLPQGKDEDLKYHPSDNTVEQDKVRIWLLCAIIFFIIWFHWEFRPNSGKSSFYLLLYSWAILATALFVATEVLGEPLSFTDGVSLWPTIFIQIIAILMAIAFFVRARKELDQNFCGLSRQYFLATVRDLTQCQNECGWGLSKLSRERSFLSFVILISTIIIYIFNDVNPSESGLPFYYCLALLVAFLLLLYLGFCYLRKEEGRDRFSIKHWIERDTCNQGDSFYRIFNALRSRILSWSSNRSDSRSGPCRENYENGLWREYYDFGLPDNRLLRVVAIWLFFAIIETILIYLLPPWPLPCRGNIACSLASGMGVLSFTAIMLLLFYILDAVRLNFYWIKKLRTQHPLLTDNVLAVAAINNPLASLEKIVAVVAERTEVVDKLIYYPMLCIMLMLFARITYFDNQDFPLSKGITFAASISLLFFSGFMLRYEAGQLKRSVIQCAEDLGKKNRRIQPEARKVIKRIKGICEGAFEPMFEQPVLRALLIILASAGLFVGEYLKIFE